MVLQGEQQTVFVVIASALSGTGGPNVHYVDDPGGSGKSFLLGPTGRLPSLLSLAGFSTSMRGERDPS